MAAFDQHFAANDHLYISTLVRAYDYCRASSGFAFGSQSGVSAEAHQAVPEVEWVSAAAQVYAWHRSPRLMEQAFEERRVRNEADCLRLFESYKRSRLGTIKRDPDLRYDVEGEMLEFPLPVSLGKDAMLPPRTTREI